MLLYNRHYVYFVKRSSICKLSCKVVFLQGLLLFPFNRLVLFNGASDKMKCMQCNKFDVMNAYVMLLMHQHEFNVMNAMQ